jgi:hypothetical protein
MVARLLAAAMIFAAVPQLVLAQPAVVRVFEAAARSAPAPDAPVLHVFPENAAVSVGETAENGWRKVRIPDGSVAWLEESALSFAPLEAAKPVPADRAIAALGAAEPAGITKTDARPKIFVKDLAHIAELTKSDAIVYPMAQRLESRRRAAIATGVVGLGASVVLMAIGFKQLNDDFDESFDSPDYQAPSTRGTGPLIGGLAVAGLTPILMWAILPKRNDLLDVLNTWNTRHPDEPFEMDAVGRR